MAGKTGTTLHQIGALPIRWDADGTLRVMLVTSRETRRWIIPKGWPMKGKKDHDAAAQEAREEAGVEGNVAKEPVGSYLYWKRRDSHFDLCQVAVYILTVEKQLKKWREQSQRETGWFSIAEAAQLVAEPGLCTLISALSTIDASAYSGARK
jgi:8-oxo-dGTP pyrophosphatase MutT (NUDIX family)